MNRKTDKKGSAVSVLFTTLLFLVFVLCALLIVLISSRAYENINVRSDTNYTGNTALSYIANKARQDNRTGMVNVADMGGIQVLETKQEIRDSEYVTWVYWDEGSIRKLFTDIFSGPGPADGLEILKCQSLEFSKDDKLLCIEAVGEGGGSLESSL